MLILRVAVMADKSRGGPGEQPLRNGQAGSITLGRSRDQWLARFYLFILAIKFLLKEKSHFICFQLTIFHIPTFLS